MNESVIAGYDPGGNGTHGVAALYLVDGRPSKLATTTVSTVEKVYKEFDGLSGIDAIGIDTLTCWSTAESGARPADYWLRDKYPEVEKSIMFPNSIHGSMVISGMAVLLHARNQMPEILITETHPKVLYWYIKRRLYNYQQNRNDMDQLLAEQLGVHVETRNEHEWDAAISAYAALERSRGAWPHDLHEFPWQISGRPIQPCGPTSYAWPEK